MAKKKESLQYKSHNKKNRVKDVFGKLKSEKNLIRLVIVSMLLIAICVFIGIYHIRTISNTFEQTTYAYIFDKAQVTSQNFSADFQRKGKSVASEAVVLEGLETIDVDNIYNCLLALEASSEFDYAVYISNRDIMYHSNEKTTRAYIADYAEEIDTTENYTVFKNINPEESNDELCFASPVLHNGLLQGYLIGVEKAATMFESFDNDSASAVAERYICDGDGDILIYTKGNNIYDGIGKNIYTILTRNSLDDYDAEIVKEEIQGQLVSDQLNRRQVTIDGMEGYVLFTRLAEASGWSLFYVVYDHNVRAIISSVLVQASIAILAIILVMLVMAALIMRYLSNEQKRIYRLAYVDELTSAPNLNAFIENATAILKDNPDIPYVMMCFDILNFRYINEGYGHEKADILLRTVASAIAETRSYNECYARLDSDRFVTLSVDDGRNDDRKIYILDKVKEEMDKIPMKYPIKLKAGRYYIKNRKESVADMIDKANLARKAVNTEERTLEADYKDQLMESTKKQENIESRMEAALEKGEFKPYLQAKWDMEVDHICGAEALIRWKQSDGSIVPPGDFIPLFEKNGFIERIDFFMLEEICKYIRKMLDEGREVYPVSINQSRYLMYDPNYLQNVQEIMLKYKVPKGLVELELTETVFFNEKDRMLDVMRKLKEFNMNLSIDDFGSGYSSLNLLRDIPFDVLKIDRGFLDESSQSESGKWILQKIVEMAEGLHLKVICEGVETEEQVNMLLSVGCKYAQGYLYSKPTPLEEFIEKYNVPV